MVHGYHVIFGAYGFWLPNDPRGSWSDFVAAWELLRFGKANQSLERIPFDELAHTQRSKLSAAKQHLHYDAVVFSGAEAKAIGTGFATAQRKCNCTIWACSILPEHVHLVLGRHPYKVEYLAGLIKGEASKQLHLEFGHPMKRVPRNERESPSPWAARIWKVFLDDEEAIENAIQYVNDNPIKEGKPKQNWNFVEPFSGLDKGWVTYGV